MLDIAPPYLTFKIIPCVLIELPVFRSWGVPAFLFSGSLGLHSHHWPWRVCGLPPGPHTAHPHTAQEHWTRNLLSGLLALQPVPLKAAPRDCFPYEPRRGGPAALGGREGLETMFAQPLTRMGKSGARRWSLSDHILINY